MCQKASGAPFASFADVNKTDFAWTKGQPSFFRSSSIAERGFCAACGTPLSFGRIDGDRIEIMTGAFDRPDHVVPTRQFGTESRLGWVVGISNLPSQTTQQNYGPEKMATIVRMATGDSKTSRNWIRSAIAFAFIRFSLALKVESW
jgi:hypothetical protein